MKKPANNSLEEKTASAGAATSSAFQERTRKTRSVASFSLIGNVFLAIIKIASGLFSGSSAMLADGFNSAGDCVSSLTMLLGNRIASKPRDADHPYGHGKAEYIFSGLMGILLLGVAWETLKNAVTSLRNPQPLQYASIVLLVCLITVILKTSLYFYANKVGKQFKNPMTLAMAQDHRSDVFVTCATAIGVIASLLGYPFVDGTVGVLISGIIALSAFGILRDSYRVLMDTTAKASSPIIEEAQKIMEALPGIDHIDAITATPVGTSYLLVIKISVPGNMTVTESHHLTRQIKDPLMENPDVAEVIVHVNPMEEHIGPSILG